MGFETSRGPNAAPWNERDDTQASAMSLLARADAPRREALWLPLALGTVIASAVIISAAVWVADPLPAQAAATRPVDSPAPIAATATRAPGG